MKYIPLNIPFASGQTEQIDSKILPDGMFSSIVNMRMERDGRMSRRQRLTDKSATDPSGATVSTEAEGFCAPNGVIYRKTNGDAAIRTWAAGDTETVADHAGTLPLSAKVERFYATQLLLDENNPLFSGHQQASFTSQYQPQIDTDAKGDLLAAFVQGTKVVVDIRDRETFALKKQVIVATEGSDSTRITLKVIGSKATNKMVVAVYYRDTSIPLAELIVSSYRTDGDYGLIDSGRLAGGSATGFANCFDMVARPDSDSYLVAYQDGPSGNIKLDEYSFSQNVADPAVEEWHTVTPPVTILWGPTVSVDCERASGRWYFGISGLDTPNQTIYSATFFGGAITSKEITRSDHAPMGVPLGGNKAIVVTSANDGLNDQPRTQFRLWDHSDDSISLLGTFDWNYSSSATTNQTTQGFNGELAIGYPVVFGSGDTAIVKIAMSYSAGLNQATDFLADLRPSQSNAYLVSLDVATGEVTIDANLFDAGVELRSWDGTNWDLGDYEYRAMSRPLKYTREDGSTSVIFAHPVDNDPDGDGYGITAASWCRVTSGRLVGHLLRRGETLIPGGALHAFDGDRTLLAGFMAPPIVRMEFQEIITTSGMDTNESIMFTAIMEYVDANGRIWRSAPADLQTFVAPNTTDPATTMGVFWHLTAPIGVAGQSDGARVALYCSDKAAAADPTNTILYRRGTFEFGPGKIFLWANAGLSPTVGPFADAEAGTQVLYTQSGELSADPPPACQFVTATRSRVWIGGVADQNYIQASKPLNDLLGVEWSNLDNFKVFMPGAVTGLAAMDDSVIAFTRDRVYVVHGEGPDSAGNGTFGDPQLIPGSSGCINHRSVIFSELGVLYQSLRGLELVPRGFSSPVWIGQPVRDTLEQFPVCRGVTQSPADWTVRWLFVDDDRNPTDARVIVFDLRAKAWFVHSYTSSAPFEVIGQCVGKDGDSQHTSVFLGNPGGELAIESLASGYEALSADDAWIETGDIRAGVLQGWLRGRRVHALGQYGGRDCNVILEWAYDSEPYRAQDTFTWNMVERGFSEGSPVELELHLPRQKFSSIRFRLRVQSLSDATDNKYTFKPNGLTLYYSREASGPRLGARSRG